MKVQERGTPRKVSSERLRTHFRTTYSLSEEQIDIMLKSSANSLDTSLKTIYEVLDNDGSLDEVSRLGHSIKGLLLNMGELEWAEIAKEVEKSAGRGEKKDYRSIIESIHHGLEEILEFSQN